MKSHFNLMDLYDFITSQLKDRGALTAEELLTLAQQIEPKTEPLMIEATLHRLVSNESISKDYDGTYQLSR